jgi:hypothetical protein
MANCMLSRSRLVIRLVTRNDTLHDVSFGVKKIQTCCSIPSDLHNDALLTSGVHQRHHGRAIIFTPHPDSAAQLLVLLVYGESRKTIVFVVHSHKLDGLAARTVLIEREAAAGVDDLALFVATSAKIRAPFSVPSSLKKSIPAWETPCLLR